MSTGHPSHYADTGSTCHQTWHPTRHIMQTQGRPVTRHDIPPVTLYRHRVDLSPDMPSHPSHYTDTGSTCHQTWHPTRHIIQTQGRPVTRHDIPPVTLYRHKANLSLYMTSHPSHYTDTGSTCHQTWHPTRHIIQTQLGRPVTRHDIPPVTLYRHS